MKLSPLEIKKQEFDRSFRGYDVEEVQSFLQMVASQWESLREQNRRLEEEVSELENKIEHYQKVEEALQDALDTARENAQQKMENAEEKADHLVREAEQKAERIRNEAEEERYAIRREVSELKHRRQEIVTRLRAFLISEMEMLAQYEGDDPIGFIKFLPEGADHDERPDEGPDDAPDHVPEDVPEEDEIPSAREYLEARREEGPDEPPAESSAGSSEHAGAAGDEGPNSGEGEHEDRTDFEAPHPSENAGEAAGLEQPAAEAPEGETEEEPRWRVHSVLSEEEEEAEPEPAESRRGDSENRGGGDPTEELSSEEMDKIRRILDELE